MPISRNRTDRRRRVMLDAIANDADLALETAKAKRRSRAQTPDDSDESYGIIPYRDPGYSQAVRRTCQQRLVQLIPVRRGTVAIALTTLWIGFGVLVFAHYWLHVRASASSTWQLGKLPIAQLFHLRSPHGISHWLTSQLWLLTALASWMIFSLRRHKLDDYRARYRIWIAVALVALFLGFDAATSGLMLFGMSIDSWTRKEIGYGGWPLVYATVASLMGVLSIRLCSELKSVPSSVASWLFGLLACAASGLLGTGLLRLEWSVSSLEFIVGSLWLGGILAVFQSAAMYLRHSYISAQKRFLQRNGVSLAPIQWKIPKIKLPRRRSRSTDDSVRDGDENEVNRRGWKLPWTGRRSEHDSDLAPRSTSKNRSKRELDEDSYDDEEQRNTTSADRDNQRRNNRGSERDRDREQDRDRRPSTSSPASSSDKPAAKKLFGLIPNRHLRNEELEYDPVAEDEGFDTDRGLTKKRGWFGIGGNKHSEENETPTRAEPKVARMKKSQEDQNQDEETGSSQRKSWFSRKRSSGDEPRTQSPSSSKSGRENEEDQVTETRTRRGWIPKLPLPKRAARDSVKPSDDADAPPKRSLLSFRKKGSSPSDANDPSKSDSKREGSTVKHVDKPAKEKRSWFGMLDGLKLKPPTADDSTASSAPSKKPEPVSVNKPVAIKPGASVPSTQSPYEEDEDDSRPMSKAERKRLRRQQDDRRAG